MNFLTAITVAGQIFWHGAVDIKPPAAYEPLYEQLSACTEIERSFQDIRWLVAQWIAEFDPAAGQVKNVEAVWLNNRTIVLRLENVYNKRVVAHEMLHDLLEGGEHTDPVFSFCLSLAISGAMEDHN